MTNNDYHQLVSQKFEQCQADAAVLPGFSNWCGASAPIGLDSSQLFISKYQLYLPDREELQALILKQLNASEE
jgi:hypothetical protein